MTTQTSKETDEAEIRRVIDAWAAAIRAKDAKGVVSQFVNTDPRFLPTTRVFGCSRSRISAWSFF